MSRDATKRLSKIKYQIKKGEDLAILTDKDKVELAQGIINAAINDDSIIIDSEMPNDMFGADLDWSAGGANDSIVGISSGSISIEQDGKLENVEVVEQVISIYPYEVTDFLSYVSPGIIHIRWENPTDSDFDHVEIWYGIDNTDTEFTGTIDNTNTDINIQLPVPHKVLIKTVDINGNKSVGLENDILIQDYTISS